MVGAYERKACLMLIVEEPTLHLCFSNCFLHLCSNSDSTLTSFVVFDLSTALLPFSLSAMFMTVDEDGYKEMVRTELKQLKPSTYRECTLVAIL